MAFIKKSPWVIHYDASSCNGCDIEVLAALCPGFDAERFGVVNTGNPKHADIFLVTGSVNERNIEIVREIYDQMLEPKVVVACGICACTGGIFHDCYNVIGGVDQAIPVDVYAPGCAIRPETIIDAVVEGVGVLEQKREGMRQVRRRERALRRSGLTREEAAAQVKAAVEAEAQAAAAAAAEKAPAEAGSPATCAAVPAATAAATATAAPDTTESSEAKGGPQCR